MLRVYLGLSLPAAHVAAEWSQLLASNVAEN